MNRQIQQRKTNCLLVEVGSVPHLRLQYHTKLKKTVTEIGVRKRMLIWVMYQPRESKSQGTSNSLVILYSEYSARL